MAHPTYTNDVSSNRVDPRPVKIGVDATTGGMLVKAVDAGALPIPAYDEIAIVYVTAGNGIGEIETATYKLATVTVGTVTYTYDANDQVSNIVLS